jgi:CDP-glycerol glycerophosphotransferase (TagB/SpsB family)
LNQAAVLITDYNDVQYDFAYMEKPIVYYHPDALPPTYESGAFDYETMGFGPVAKDPGELAGRLSALLGTGGDGPSDADESADMTGTYAARARAFFAYHDRENRSRIYEEIEKEYGE